LSAKRRINLYALAKKYQFLILEDDYDFDYHYQNTPTLPLASMDTESLVIYVGSFSKLLYPGIRIGFVVAPLILIEEMSKYRRIIDLQGDHLMERTIANLMLEGVMDRYLRKSKALYKRRKEHFCRLLREEFKSYVDFIEPEGGMAVWVTFKDNYPLIKVASLCREKNLFISNALNYNSPVRQVNACRMGFASMTETEMKMACNILKDVLDSL
jgi:GntR family transcriptional regulator/MocR family aminotransferase